MKHESSIREGNSSNGSTLFSKNCPFLVLDEGDRQRLLNKLALRRYEKGEFIHQAGDLAKGIFCTFAGVVRISSNDANGSYVLVKDMMPGEWFGFMGYFGNGHRPQDAIALASCQLAYLKGEVLESILATHPQVYRVVLNQLANYSTDFFDRYAGAVGLSLRSHLSQMLLKIAAWQDTSELSLTQADLASFLGVTREAAGVQLNRLQQHGAIQLKYKKIKIINSALLSESIL